MILVSIGHHEDKPGACFDGICEYDLAIKWAEKIVEHLKDKGRLVPVGVLKKKVNFINSRNVVLAVEIHFNSYKMWKDLNKDGVVDANELKPAGQGSETLYYPKSKLGKAAAELVQDSMGMIMVPSRGIKEGWYRMEPKNGPDYFLAKTNCTALIIEPEFIDNIDILAENQDECCEAIASALIGAELLIKKEKSKLI
jgi:N-acetylmuramoyl-L-alanine amidase